MTATMFCALFVLMHLAPIKAFHSPLVARPPLSLPLPKHAPLTSVPWISTNYRPQVSSSLRFDSSTSLRMSFDDDGQQGSNLITTVIVVGILAIFVVSGVAPMVQLATSPNTADMNLRDAVATRQDNARYAAQQKQGQVPETAQFERLSRAKIQEKLNRVPVFYLVGGNGEMGGSIYLSYADAVNAKGEGATVKCTTLDQVMYPLVLRRGRMRMAPPPEEVRKAEETEDAKFVLVPSASAVQDAKDTGVEVRGNDVPLFAANKLAFASTDGPQVPLFLDKADCVTTYNRLRESNPKLPAEPTVRATTLVDELFSMEKGTRPAVSQLQFYTTADDLLRASEMMQ